MEKKNANYRKHYKTLIDPAGGCDSTVYRLTLKAVLKVLARDFGYPEKDSAKAIDAFLLTSEIIETTTHCKIVKNDPADDRVLECALDSEADYLATYDHHLLSLGKIGHAKIAKPEQILNQLDKT